MNPLRASITHQTQATLIMMQAQTFSGVFLLLEGRADISLFKSFTTNNVKLFDCCGRSKLFEAISELERRGFDRSIGFADKDYCDTVGYPDYQGVVVFTDKTDMETSIISSPAFEKLISNFASEVKTEGACQEFNGDARAFLYNRSAPLGAFRRLSSTKGWQVSFKEIKYRLKSGKSGEIDLHKMVNQVMSNSPKYCGPCIKDVLIEIDALVKACTSPDALCRGHDLTSILAKLLGTAFGSDNTFNSVNSLQSFERVLRVAYEYEFFKQTHAYSQLKFFERAVGIAIMKV